MLLWKASQPVLQPPNALVAKSLRVTMVHCNALSPYVGTQLVHMFYHDGDTQPRPLLPSIRASKLSKREAKDQISQDIDA
jgi:hypothetical protein